MKVLVDYGTWERGKVIEVEAETLDEIFEEAQSVAEENDYPGDFVQIREAETRNLLWDYMHGSYIND